MRGWRKPLKRDDMGANLVAQEQAMTLPYSTILRVIVRTVRTQTLDIVSRPPRILDVEASALASVINREGLGIACND